ncbi:MAG: alpha/beta hydrolase [Alphaproteobacteria bacterium]|jgi:pimeloyl-ACP methyl ester carboxylesterase|nr:alpha/beta hydrolase [Alphaproteobacteria bacterium]MDP6566662.1 alpha/beta hydrolase [Alphaproteobacteria bacterium]
MSHQDLTFPFLSPEGFMPICYRQWGDPDNPKVLICVHGLSRNRMDFDELSQTLSDRYRVMSIDMPGRGGSGWLQDKEAYAIPLYEQVCATAVAVSGAVEVDWVGTSMGGLIGMGMAARPGSPIRRLVLNDIGPHVPAAGRRDNQAAFGDDPQFKDFEAAVAWHKEHRSGFGPMPEDGWRQMTEVSLRPLEDGGYALHYDPGLAINQKREPVEDIDLWGVWEQIRCPLLTVWGTESKLLLADDLRRMQDSGPRTQVLPVEDVGHAPRLSGEAVIGGIAEFLAAG